MTNVNIISTWLDKNYLNNKEVLYLGDFAIPLNNYNENKVLDNKKSNIHNRKKLFNFNKKIINILFKDYKKFYKSKISKKSFFLIVSPFVFTFLDIIRNKYNSIDDCKKEIKSPHFSTLDNKDFSYPKSFSEFLSKIQSDKFNLQLNTEVITFKKFNNTKLKFNKNIKNEILKFFKKKNNDKILNIKKKINQTKLKINDKTYFHKLRFRHNFALNKLLKKNKDYQIFNNSKINLENLIQVEKNFQLRKKILNNFAGNNTEEKFYINLLLKYIPTLYLESIEMNINNISSNLKNIPANIVSNAHGWWGDDHFRYYLSICINNKTRYLDVQHNGTYFIIDDNVHFDISSLFRDRFIGWGKACSNYSYCSQLPALYSIQKKIKKKIKGKRIMFMSANISRFFEGYRNSYLSGGQNLKYFFNQILFFNKLNLNLLKNISIRTRFNTKDPNDYLSFLKKKFNKIKIEDLKNTAFNRLNKQDVKIIIVDHCSTPWLEALYVNKPLIIFWDKDINKISNKFSYIFKELKKNKILFYTPKDAANRLNEISHQDIDWWYSKKIQKLREKILTLFFSYDNNAINIWNKKLKNIISN